MSCVTLTLWRFETTAAKLWMFGQMGLARPSIFAMDGLKFCKLLGTGAGAGFSTIPNFSRYGMLCVWPDAETAVRALSACSAVQRLAVRSTETVTLFLEPTRTRGKWAGREPFDIAADVAPSGVVVALTRATLRLRNIRQFWSLVPSISEIAEMADTQHFMLGLGEVPYRNQVTFSIWSDEDDMAAFARSSPSHGEAVRRAWQEGWFAEYLFARFNLTKVEGEWRDLDAVRHMANTNAGDVLGTHKQAVREAAE